MAIILENGLIPNQQIIRRATVAGSTYNFLYNLVDPEKSILFKNLNMKLEPKQAHMALAEFEADTKSQAISNLYLSA